MNTAAVTSLLVFFLMLGGCSSPPSEMTASTTTPGKTSSLGTTSSTTSSSTTTLSTTSTTASTSSSSSSSSSSSGPLVHPVLITGSAYKPVQLTIAAGDQVRWTNNDGGGHTVTSDAIAPAAFDSGNIASDGKYTFTFATAGTYPYHCAYHSTMHGSIVVE